jgi:hypothetical protein
VFFSIQSLLLIRFFFSDCVGYVYPKSVRRYGRLESAPHWHSEGQYVGRDSFASMLDYPESGFFMFETIFFCFFFIYFNFMMQSQFPDEPASLLFQARLSD